MDRQQLIGAWELVSFRIEFSDQRPALFPFGGDATGLIVYSDNGWMSAILSRAKRDIASASTMENANSATDTEKVSAFDSYLSYAGRFELTEDEVIHHVSLSMNPAVIGSEQRRHYQYDEKNGILTLHYDIEAKSGVTRRYYLLWSRSQKT